MTPLPVLIALVATTAAMSSVSSPSQERELIGRWAFEILETPSSTLRGVFTFRDEGNVVTGEMELHDEWFYPRLPGGPQPFTEVRVGPDGVGFDVVIEVRSSYSTYPFRYVFSAEVSADRMVGTVIVSGFGTYRVEATKLLR